MLQKIGFVVWMLMVAVALQAGITRHLATDKSYISGSDETTFAGSVRTDIVRKIVKSNMGDVRACYDQNATPELKGKIILQWTIGSDGYVLEAAVTDSTLASKAIETCLLDELKSWKFPSLPRGDESIVRYTFEFRG